jgi:hypothetical protein
MSIPDLPKCRIWFALQAYAVELEAGFLFAAPGTVPKKIASWTGRWKKWRPCSFGLSRLFV